MGKLDKVYNLVWYGDCDDPDCQPVDLSLYKDDLEFVFQISDVNSGWKHWSSATDAINLGDFADLICGVPYIIKLTSDDKVKPNKVVEIPGVTVGRFADDPTDATSKRISDNCVPAKFCTFVVDNVLTSTFDLTIYMSTIDSYRTNNYIRGFELFFDNVKLKPTGTISHTFQERVATAVKNDDNEEEELFRELIKRTSSLVSFDEEGDTTYNKWGFSDLRKFSTGISLSNEFQSSYKFTIPFDSIDGELKVNSANIYDTTVGRYKFDYVLCDGYKPPTNPTPTPTQTPTPTSECIKPDDEYCEELVFHLQSKNETDGSDAVIDASLKNHPLEFPNGRIKHSSDRRKFGESSFDFTGNEVIKLPQSEDWRFLQGQFTIDAWVYVDSFDASSNFTRDKAIFASLATQQIMFGIDNKSGKLIMWDGLLQKSSDEAVVARKWTHVGVTRDGSILRMYIDAKKVFEDREYSSNFYESNSFSIGGAIDFDSGDSGYTRLFNGYINDLRVVKGVALYTSDRFCEYEDFHEDCEHPPSPTPTKTDVPPECNPEHYTCETKIEPSNLFDNFTNFYGLTGVNSSGTYAVTNEGSIKSNLDNTLTIETVEPTSGDANMVAVFSDGNYQMTSFFKHFCLSIFDLSYSSTQEVTSHLALYQNDTIYTMEIATGNSFNDPTIQRGPVVAESFVRRVGMGPEYPILSTGNRFRVGLAFSRTGVPVASEIVLQNGFDICLSRNMLFVPDDETTPTPTATITPEEPLNCCMDFDNSVDVTAGMVDTANTQAVVFRGIALSGFEFGGIVCINELTETVQDLSCLVATADFLISGQVGLSQKSNDNKLRYTSAAGDCYEADLEHNPELGYVFLNPVT